MDLSKLKKDLTDKGIEKSKEELEKLKARFSGQGSGQTTNATTTPAQTDEPHVGPATDHYSGQMANAGHTGTTPVMDAGKRDIREPETPAKEEEIREPDPEEQEGASESADESRREAALEENPASDDEEEAA